MNGLCKVPDCPEEAMFPIDMIMGGGVIGGGVTHTVGLCADHFAWFVRGRESGADMRPVMEQLFLLEYDHEA
jgi:hypothetical protein